MNPPFHATLAAVAAMVSLAAASTARGQTYDLQGSLQASQPTPFNPTGPFGFGRFTAAVDPSTFVYFTQFTNNIGGTGMEAFYNGGDPNVIYNNTGAPQGMQYGFTQEPGDVTMGPAGGPVAVQFTVPADGDYQIDANFLQIQSSNSTATAFVFDDLNQVASGAADVNGFTYSDVLTLFAGDTLDFVLANGNATTRFQLTVTAIPEPGSLALLGVGAAGLLGRRNFRRK